MQDLQDDIITKDYTDSTLEVYVEASKIAQMIVTKLREINTRKLKTCKGSFVIGRACSMLSTEAFFNKSGNLLLGNMKTDELLTYSGNYATPREIFYFLTSFESIFEALQIEQELIKKMQKTLKQCSEKRPEIKLAVKFPPAPGAS